MAQTSTVLLSFASLRYLSISDANALNFTWPVFALLASIVVLGEGARRAEVVGLAGAVVSSVCVARPSFIFGRALLAAPISPVGVLLSLAGAMLQGVTVVLIRKLVKSVHWTVVLIWQTLGQSVMSPIAMGVLGSAFVISRPIIGYSLATGALASVHQILLTKGLAKERVGAASAVQSTFVLSSFALQLTLTPEDVLEPVAVVGALGIIASVALILLTKNNGPSGTRAQGGTLSVRRADGLAGADSAHQAWAEGTTGEGHTCATVEPYGSASGYRIDEGQELNDAARAALESHNSTGDETAVGELQGRN